MHSLHGGSSSRISSEPGFVRHVSWYSVGPTPDSDSAVGVWMPQPVIDYLMFALLKLTPEAVMPSLREALAEIGVAVNVVETPSLSTSGRVSFKAGITLLAGVRLREVAADGGSDSSGASWAGYSRRRPRYRGGS